MTDLDKGPGVEIVVVDKVYMHREYSSRRYIISHTGNNET